MTPLIKARDKGLCQQCLREGLVVSGTTVDHIIPANGPAVKRPDIFNRE
ncbi:hypothetical protein yaldo0001_40640 [Yersinia aldovae ATCC 35236]|nr:hypothetical protein yaldo0001_40640 [Yersinia aldovae ATCC 35236]